MSRAVLTRLLPSRFPAAISYGKVQANLNALLAFLNALLAFSCHHPRKRMIQ
jgi:hypothetical protein